MKVAQERQFYVHDRFVAYNGDQAEFSNFYVAPFKAPVLTANDRPVMEFKSVEQYFAYNKAILFGDNEIAQKIMAHTRGAKLKADGRNHILMKRGNHMFSKCCRQVCKQSLARIRHCVICYYLQDHDI